MHFSFTLCCSGVHRARTHFPFAIHRYSPDHSDFPACFYWASPNALSGGGERNIKRIELVRRKKKKKKQRIDIDIQHRFSVPHCHSIQSQTLSKCPFLLPRTPNSIHLALFLCFSFWASSILICIDFHKLLVLRIVS